MSIKTLKMKDEINPKVGISEEGKKKIAKALSGQMASTYALYLKTLYYHWNVVGPNFKPLHELFEDHYENLHESGDELAERIRALGFKTPGTIKELTELTVIEDDKQLPEKWEEMVENLVKGNELASQNARAVLNIAEEYGDEVTIDLMVDRMKFHDEAAWMLRSTIEQ